MAVGTTGRAPASVPPTNVRASVGAGEVVGDAVGHGGWFSLPEVTRFLEVALWVDGIQLTTSSLGAAAFAMGCFLALDNDDFGGIRILLNSQLDHKQR